MADRLLLFDFDGTLCLGDDPVRAYAEQIDALLASVGGSIAETVAETLDRGDLRVEGLAAQQDLPYGQRHGPQDGQRHRPQDGYQLVQLLGRAAGLSAEECGEAFRTARRRLLDVGLSSTDVHSPPGAAELLAHLRAHAAVVLITNAPAVGFAPWLETLGLTGAFDAVVNDAGKPEGMPAALAEARRRTGCGADVPTLSVGDIWVNDLAPLADSATTVLIDHFGTGAGAPTHRVRRFAEAASLLRRWAGA